MEISELRNWTLLVLATIGAYVTIRNFINSVKQRKIDNTFKTLDFIRNHIKSEQIETFIELFHANNELKGDDYNEFKFQNGRSDTIEFMFSEGGCGNGDIQNMIELFNLISPTIDKLEKEIIWYEYGQIMNKLYQWTEYLEKHELKNGSSLDHDKFYSKFNVFMKKNWKNMLFKPTKYYTYAE
jgi:hypothetical protein